MFLLNEIKKAIKNGEEIDLQYKMFLLNNQDSFGWHQLFPIYNTKCSY